jgi:hypothetical protein
MPLAELARRAARPAPFSRYTAEELWTDDHTSARMLAFHLDATDAETGHDGPGFAIYRQSIVMSHAPAPQRSSSSSRCWADYGPCNGANGFLARCF